MSSSERRGKRAEREERRGKRAEREERREKREERDKHDHDKLVEVYNGPIPEWGDGTEKGRSLKMRGSKEAMVRAQNGGMVQKRVGP